MTEKMNASQRRAYRNVIDSITYASNGSALYEVKELTVTELEGTKDVLVQVRTGLPNDEGKLSELLCRDTYTFFIGARGGLYRITDGYTTIYMKYYEVGKYCRARY